MELIIDPANVEAFANIHGSCDEQCSCVGCTETR